MNYLNNYCPPDYRCGRCGAAKVKLWRDGGSFFSITLMCATCACITQGKNVDVDSDGMNKGKYGRSDQIGWFVPAVPTEDERGYWGYTSVPEQACVWWKKLPVR